MRKKMRNSLVVIVVLVVILGVGFGVWKIFFAPRPLQPLKIKDLEDAHITTTRSPTLRGWNVEIIPNDRETNYGMVRDYENVFTDGLESAILKPVMFYIIGREPSEGGSEVNIQAGDTFELTYDGGTKLTVYSPAFSGWMIEQWVYIATDGSTYYDKALTKLAQPAPPKPDEEVKNE